MFSSVAPAYWAAGVPVIPLRPKTKAPQVGDWSTYCHALPDTDTQAQWLAAYPDSNIGLTLGPQSGMLVIDLDSEDPKVLEVLERILPPSPWKRVGKKGAVWAYKFNGERSTRIAHEDGSMIVEILSAGSQVVLPPSIHPDTQMPYVANRELLEVIDQLSVLPHDFETTLRKAMIDAGIKVRMRGTTNSTGFVSSGGRDNALTSMAGIEARGVLRGERSLLEALNQIEVWVANYTQKVAGDSMDPEKGKQKLMEFLHRDLENGKRALPKRWSEGMDPEQVADAKTYLGQDIDEWTVDAIIEDLTEQFIRVPVEAVGERGEIIDGTLRRLAKSSSLTDVQTDMVLKFLQQACGRHINMGSLRKRFLDLTQGELTGKDQTEIALAAVHEVEKYGALRYWGVSFYQWVGDHWEEVPDSELLSIIAKEFGDLHAAKKYGDHKGILQIMANQVPNGLGDAETVGINFANGYLNLDGQLLNHDPSFGCTYVLPYRYMPEGDAPQRWFSLLDQAWGHNPDYADKVRALRQAIAASLFKMAPRFSRAFLLFGVAHSGKSTIKKVIEGLVPSDSLCCVPPHDWADKFLPTQMQNKLLNSCGELSETEMISGSRFKTIVEGEEMSGQHKGKDIFKFRPLCAQWFASNHLPRSRDTSEGFNRRWLILQFDRAVPLATKVTGLDREIIEDEKEAIVAWAVGGIADLLSEQDYTLPLSHVAMTDRVANQNNSVRSFLVEGGVRMGEGSANEKDVYLDYYMYCRRDGHGQPMAQKRFSMAMLELQQKFNFEVVTQGGPDGVKTIYKGITLISHKKAA